MIEKNSNVPRIVDRLEIKKLVKRTTSQFDKRETVITLTQAGILLLEASTKSIDQNMETLSVLNETESAQLNKLLEKMRSLEE